MKPPIQRFVRETICAACIAPDDERLGNKLSFLELTCARCDRVLTSAIVVQRLKGARAKNDGTVRGGLSSWPTRVAVESEATGVANAAPPPGDGLSPKGCDTASHDPSPAYADLSPDAE